MDSRIPKNDVNNVENSARKQKLLNLLCNKTQHDNIQSSNQKLYSLLRNTMNNVNTQVNEAKELNNKNIAVTNTKSSSTNQMETIEENE